MNHLNLNLYTVEQVNHSADNSASNNWGNGSERGLNNVVDPNTEFQVAARSSVPASPLESYGFLTPPHTPAACRKLLKGLETIIAQEKISSNSSEIPQVHGYISERRMSSSSSRAAYDRSQPMIHGEQPGMMTKYFPTTASDRRSYRNSNLKDSKSEIKTSDSLNSTPTMNHVQSCKEPYTGTVVDGRSVLTVERAATSEQLAWAFRTAQNRLETASNMSECSSRFELESNCSERADSMSTFSDVSGYEEELYRIRRLLLQDSPSPYLEKHLGNHSHYMERKRSLHSNAPHGSSNGDTGTISVLELYKENTEQQIKTLNSQLQIALAEKETYRMQLDEAESKLLLEWQQRYQDVLRQKANTDGRLETVQAEVEILRRSVAAKTRIVEMQGDKGNLESELVKLHNLYRDVQARYQEQSMQLELSETEVKRWKEEAQETDSTNEKFRIQLQELRVDTESKDGSIHGLKLKVTDQHVELQSLLQAKLKAENNVATVKNEMETVRKSGLWYREQLHACQSAKVKVQQELMTSQTNVVTYSHLVEKLKGEAENLRSIAEETQERAVREKNTLMRKLETIHADMLEREATILSQLLHEDTTIETVTAKLRSIEENRAIESSEVTQELERQIETLKQELEARDATMKQLNTENASLLMRITTLQKTMNDKEFVLQSIENKCRNMEMMYNSSIESLRDKGQVVLELKNEKVILEVALAAAAREKTEVDAAIEKLRDDFARISKSYQSMRSELGIKEKVIVALEEKVQDFSKIEEQQKKKISGFVNVEQELREIQIKIAEVHDWEQLIKEANNKNDELNRKNREVTEAKDYALAQTGKLQEMLKFREEQLLNQTHNFEVHVQELLSRDNLISTLEADKRSLHDSIEGLNTRIANLEESNLAKSKEIDLFGSQLARSNFVIEQFNILCRGSEEENHQLKQLMKDLESAPIETRVTNVAISTQTNQLITVCSSVQTIEKPPLFRKDSVQSQTEERGQPESQDFKRMIEQLKCALKMSDLEKRDKQRRYETNIRTLLKKVKEHMRGRKVVEKAFEELRSASALVLPPVEASNVISLQAEISRLEAEVEVGRRQCSELKKIVERNEETVLELEKERGKLVQVQTGTIMANQGSQNLAHQTKDMKVVEMSKHVKDLEEQYSKQQIIINELKKSIFIEKRDCSQLRKQVSSLQLGLDTANDVLDNKKIDLGRSEAMNEILRDANARLQQTLDVEQVTHENCKQDMEKLKMELEDARAKDPMLADQLKMLSYHLHDKTQEASNLLEHNRLSRERWLATENGFKRNISDLKEEVTALREELNSVRSDKFTLQTQAVELRHSLQSSLEQNKLLRLRVEAFGSPISKDSGLPDLTSSLPSAPMKYNEEQIAELLHQSQSLPCNRPLNNLESCLDSLKQEMATLQQQLIAKTSAQGTVKEDNSSKKGKEF